MERLPNGYVDNASLHTGTHGLRADDIITFEPRHAYDVGLEDDEPLNTEPNR